MMAEFQLQRFGQRVPGTCQIQISGPGLRLFRRTLDRKACKLAILGDALLWCVPRKVAHKVPVRPQALFAGSSALTVWIRTDFDFTLAGWDEQKLNPAGETPGA